MYAMERRKVCWTKLWKRANDVQISGWATPRADESSWTHTDVLASVVLACVEAHLALEASTAVVDARRSERYLKVADGVDDLLV